MKTASKHCRLRATSGEQLQHSKRDLCFCECGRKKNVDDPADQILLRAKNRCGTSWLVDFGFSALAFGPGASVVWQSNITALLLSSASPRPALVLQPHESLWPANDAEQARRACARPSHNCMCRKLPGNIGEPSSFYKVLRLSTGHFNIRQPLA
jgi:hypothetical protein